MPAAPAETEAPAEGAGEEAGEEGGSGSEQVGGELVDSVIVHRHVRLPKLLIVIHLGPGSAEKNIRIRIVLLRLNSLHI